MDVCARILVIFSFIVLANCSQKQEAATSSQFVKSKAPGCEQQAIAGEYLVVWKSGQVTVEHFKNDQEFMDRFFEQNKDQIKISEPHYRLTAEPFIDVSERGYGGERNWGVDTVEAASVWSTPLPRSEVIVAVIDSGLDVTHPELQGTLAVNGLEEFNGVDDDGNGLVDDVAGYNFADDSGEVVDYTGHGTHVSGVIAARHDVGAVLGVAPGIKILPLGFIRESGGGEVSAAIRAIRYAALRGARVINASWGGGCSLPLKDEIAQLAKENILFVSAAGNSRSDLSIYPEYPAAFRIDNMITVGASTVDRKMPDFSNYGMLVDIVAPGANIVSTFPLEFDAPSQSDQVNDGMRAMNGTSMAAPFVSGAAALLWSFKPQASFIEVKAAILAGIEPGPFYVQSRGELNIRKALEALNP